MKWFKHFTDSLDDPFIQDLLDIYRSDGYLAYFGLIEIIAKENKDEITGKLRIKPIYLKRKTRISKNKLLNIYRFCEENDKLSIVVSNSIDTNFGGKQVEYWDFYLEKMLKIRDNHTGKSEDTDGIPAKVKKAVVERDKRTCRYCGKVSNSPRIMVIGLDVNKPIVASNLVVCCKPCRDKRESGLMTKEMHAYFKKVLKQIPLEAEVEVEVEAEADTEQKSKPKSPPPYKDIITFLNQTLGFTGNAGYRHNTEATRKKINARYAEGYTLDNFKAVIASKHKEWGSDPKMRGYLTPETLFGTKFQKYLVNCSNQNALPSRVPTAQDTLKRLEGL